MECIIYRRRVRAVEQLNSLEELPEIKGIRLIARLLHYDSCGEFLGLQYALYYDKETYTVDLRRPEDWLEFHEYLGKKIEAAGIKPKMAVGGIQGEP